MTAAREHRPGPDLAARSETAADIASRTSRFTPDIKTMHELVLAANERAERLARRIGAAERAVRGCRPSVYVLALLGGAEDENQPTNGYCCEALRQYGTCACPNREQAIGR